MCIYADVCTKQYLLQYPCMPMYTHVHPKFMYTGVYLHVHVYYKLLHNIYTSPSHYYQNVCILVYWYTHKVLRKHGPKSCHIWIDKCHLNKRVWFMRLVHTDLSIRALVLLIQVQLHMYICFIGKLKLVYNMQLQN